MPCSRRGHTCTWQPQLPVCSRGRTAIARPHTILQVQLKTTERRRLDADNLLRGTSVQECVFTKDGVKECNDGEMIWELADPNMTVIPQNFLKGKGELTGTLKLGATVQKIGKKAFFKTTLTGLDLSDAASLEKIGAKAFYRTSITDTIETPFDVPTYKANSFPNGVSIGSIGNQRELSGPWASEFVYARFLSTIGPGPAPKLRPETSSLAAVAAQSQKLQMPESFVTFVKTSTHLLRWTSTRAEVVHPTCG